MSRSWFVIAALVATACVDVEVPDETATEEAVTVPAGTFQIARQGGTECLDVPGYAKASQVRLQGFACKRAGYLGNQQLTLEPVTGGYRLRVYDSQLCLDLPNSATADGTYIQQSQCHNNQNQIWVFGDEANGYMRITPRLDQTKCAYIDAARAVRIARCATLAVPARSFTFAPTRTYYSIRLATTGQCLDMASYTTASGASPQLFACNTTSPTASTNQEWDVQPTATAGAFRVRQRNANKCLDLRGGALADGTILEQQPCTTSTTQQWRLLDGWKLQNVASARCADFYAGALRQYTCSTAYPSQLFGLEPGISGPPLTMTSTTPVPASTGPQPSYAIDPALAPLAIVRPRLTDNAIVFEWTDSNGAATESYMIWVWETIPGQAQATAHEEFRILPRDKQSFLLAGINGRALLAGRHYVIDVMANSARGVSAAGAASRLDEALPSRTLRIGNGVAQTVTTVTALSGFAMLDMNNNGIVDGAPGAGGPFPRFANTGSFEGNQFASADGFRANVIVGYNFLDGGVTKFVAHHILIDVNQRAFKTIAVFLGDAAGGIGTQVFQSPSDAPTTINVTNGDLISGLPAFVNGTVTASVLAENGATRVVEFGFSVALEAR